MISLIKKILLGSYKTTMKKRKDINKRISDREAAIQAGKRSMEEWDKNTTLIQRKRQ